MDIHIENILFADVAGMNDTNGTLIEFVNSFVLKQLFQRTKRIKLLVPISLEQIDGQ